MKALILTLLLAGLFIGPSLADQSKKHSENASKHTEHDTKHSSVKSGKTMPADGEILHESPKHMMIHFGHAMTVKMLTLTTLTGEVIRIPVSTVGRTSHFKIELPELQPDDYTANWRATGENGHVMSGSFSFTVM